MTTTADPLSSPHPPPRRLLALFALLIGCAAVYGFVLSRFELARQPREVTFSASTGAPKFRLYLQPMQIDPSNASLQGTITIQ